MKKIILIGSVLTALGLLTAVLAVPVLASGSNSGETTPANNTAWEDMYQACQNGDWEAMEEAASEVHGENYGNMPYHEDYNSTPDENGETFAEHWDEMGSYMGGGMVGGGMMGW